MAKVVVVFHATDAISQMLASIVPANGYVRDVVDAYCWRDLMEFTCVGYGADREDLKRHEYIVKSLATRTVLCNRWVWEDGWQLVCNRLRRGESVVPDDVQDWVGELGLPWLVDEAIELWSSD
jgi:hypothetical protein